MNDASFTHIRSLLVAVAKALNLINPALENHHERTAYFSYFIRSGRRLGDGRAHGKPCTDLLHDVAPSFSRRVSLEQIESNAREYARIGADMIRDLPDFEEIAAVIEYCQTDWENLAEAAARLDCLLQGARCSAVIHPAG